MQSNRYYVTIRTKNERFFISGGQKWCDMVRVVRCITVSDFLRREVDFFINVMDLHGGRCDTVTFINGGQKWMGV